MTMTLKKLSENTLDIMMKRYARRININLGD